MNFQSTLTLVMAWAATIPAYAQSWSVTQFTFERNFYQKMMWGPGLAAITPQQILHYDGDQKFSLLDLASHKESKIWEHVAPPRNAFADVTVTTDREVMLYYVGNPSRGSFEVTELSTHTGQVMWTRTFAKLELGQYESQYLEPIVLRDNALFILAGAAQANLIDPTTGQILRTESLRAHTPSDLLLLDDGTFVAAYTGPKYKSFFIEGFREGRVLWSYEIAGHLWENMIALDSNRVLLMRQMEYGPIHPDALVWNLRTGKIEATLGASIPAIAADEFRIYTFQEDSGLTAWDRKSLRPLWTSAEIQTNSSEHYLSNSKQLFVIDEMEEAIRAFDATTGAELSKAKVPRSECSGFSDDRFWGKLHFVPGSKTTVSAELSFQRTSGSGEAELQYYCTTYGVFSYSD